MKKIILAACIALAIISCKKKDNTNNGTPPTSGTGGTTNDVYSVRIESNFLRSKMSVENITDQSLIGAYNSIHNGVWDTIKNCPITYSFTGLSTKKYRIYTTSVKNSTDTTLYMTDSDLTWNYLQVKKNGNVIYEHKDTVGYGGTSGSQRITSNECKINY
jgi:hypothetical protein